MSEKLKLSKSGQWELEILAKAKEEPHKDDPKHEQKEQDKAKKIKEKAEEILDMHKAEHCSVDANGQWKLEEKKKKK